MTSWPLVWVVFLKEWRDGWRDRRALISAFLVPLLGPFLVGVVFSALAKELHGAPHIEVHMRGAERVPGLVRFLRTQRAHVIPYKGPLPAPPKRRLVVVDIGPEVPSALATGKPALIRIVGDFSDRRQGMQRHRIRALLGGYNELITQQRLLARGINGAHIRPLKIRQVDLSTPAKRGAQLLGVVPMFILMAAFVGGAQFTMDATAGERERNALESLLLNPVPPWALVFGKWLTACGMALISVALSAAACGAMTAWAPLDELGLAVAFGPLQALLTVAVCVPLIAFAVGAQMLAGTLARTLKEAQAYFAFLMMVPTIPSLLAMLSDRGPRHWQLFVPVLGQRQVLVAVMGGEVPSTWQLLATALVPSLVGAALLVGASWALGREGAFRSQ